MNTECVSNLLVDSSREHDEDLKSCNGCQYTDEHTVGFDTFHEVEFIINLSSTEHVEDLKPDEHVEHNSQMS